MKYQHFSLHELPSNLKKNRLNPLTNSSFVEQKETFAFYSKIMTNGFCPFNFSYTNIIYSCSIHHLEVPLFPSSLSHHQSY